MVRKAVSVAVTLLTLTGCGKFNAGAVLDTLTGSTGSAKLQWNAVTTNVDATPVTDLAGYRVFYGQASGSYTETVDVGNVTTTTISSLSKGKTYYFTVKAYDTSGNLSSATAEVSKTVN